MKTILNFIKPNLKKVIFFLILMMPFAMYLLDKFGDIEVVPTESMFYIYVGVFEFIVWIVVLNLCGGFQGRCSYVSETEKYVIYLVAYLVPILIFGITFWLMACFLSWAWDKIISIKRKKVS